MGLKTLPDRISPNSKILFVGTNPGIRSASIGHYFAGKSNMFWKLLYESGLTAARLTTEFDHKLNEYKYSLTDVIKRPTRSTNMLSDNDAKGVKARLDRTIKKYTPTIVAFVGKTGFRYYLNDFNVDLTYGKQEIKIAKSIIFLLPSSSGASFADTKYDEKLFWYKALNQLVGNIQMMDQELTASLQTAKRRTDS